jgi:uncharacterized protein (DUF433 family)
MTIRPIIREHDILNGEWRFHGTLIAVRNLRSDIERGGKHARDAYRAMGLSDADIDAGLAFEFPVIEDPGVEVPFMVVTIRCVCGERRKATVTAPMYETDLCVCGRRWRIPVGIELAADGESPTPIGVP